MSNYNDDHNKNNADFIRDVELFARNALRKSDDSTKQSCIPTLKRIAPDRSDDKLKGKSKLVHEKLRNSPFYESWEQWIKTKQNCKDNHDDRTILYNRTEGKDKSKNDDKDRYDIKVHLQSSYLRMRFRCDQVLTKEDNEIGSDDNSEGQSSVKMHPLYKSLLRHVDSMTDRVKLMTKKRLESTKCVIDIETTWIMYKNGLSRYVSRNKGKNGDPNVNDVNLDVLLGNNCQIQSVPLDQATKKFDSFSNSKSLHSKSKCCYNLNDDSGSMGSDTKQEDLEQCSNHVHLKLTPECWSLFLYETISYGNHKVSIRRMKRRDEEELDYDPTAYWVVDVFENYKPEKRFVLLANEVHSIIHSTRVTNSKSNEGRKCVHSQTMNIDWEELRLVGLYTVCIIVDENTAITAIVRIEFGDIETRYGLTCIAPFEIHIPVYEIMARLQKLYLCKAFDEQFWISEQNGDLIWEPLIKHMAIKVSEKMVSK